MTHPGDIALDVSDEERLEDDRDALNEWRQKWYGTSDDDGDDFAADEYDWEYEDDLYIDEEDE